MKLLHLFREIIFAFSGLLLKKQAVIIYAPGRVGSMSLHKQLKEAGVYVFKVEMLNRNMPRSTIFVRELIFKTNRPIKIISLVRDPVAMMITYFFSSISWRPEAFAAYNKKDLTTLQRIFIERLYTDDLNNFIRWFETEFEKNLGIDVYQYPFNLNEGRVIIEQNKYKVLILRTELEKEMKSLALKNFIGTEIETSIGNSQNQKPYADIYDQFKNTIIIPQGALARIYKSQYAQHFFSKEELALLIKKWG